MLAGFCAQLMAFGDRFNSDIEAYSADIEPVRRMAHVRQHISGMAWIWPLARSHEGHKRMLLGSQPLCIPHRRYCGQ